MEQDCMSLSIEGERLLKNQDYEGAISYFEAGLRAGTDDEEVLSAVYNQLGNACFYIGRFHKALEYHKKDLEIAEKLGDRNGQAKAYGNLGNTFKSLKNYEHAVRACEKHLEITVESGDKQGEGRACYNLGNVHHAIGKAALALKTPEGVANGNTSVEKAIDYYKQTLTITTVQKDKSGEGRALGNLGNAYTAIGNYAEAIKYHEKRLELAVEAKDLAARARACGNLGNAFSALGNKDPSNFTQALKYYQQSLAVAKDSNNVPGQGQAYYCIGSTYTMLKNHVKSIEYFEQHLAIASTLNDKTGILRAWYNLRNAYHAIGDMPKTVEYHKLIQTEQGSVAPLKKPGSKMSTPNSSGGVTNAVSATKSLSTSTGQTSHSGGGSASKPKSKAKKTASKPVNTNAVMAFTISDSESDDEGEVVRYRKGEAPPEPVKKSRADEWLNMAISQVQDEPEGERYDQQDSTVPEFFNTPAMSDWDTRTKPNTNKKGSKKSSMSGGDDPDKVPVEVLANDDDFFDLLVKMQGSQMNTQRSTYGGDADDNDDEPAEDIAEKLDADNMSFFEMLAAAKK